MNGIADPIWDEISEHNPLPYETDYNQSSNTPLLTKTNPAKKSPIPDLPVGERQILIVSTYAVITSGYILNSSNTSPKSSATVC